MTSAEEECPSSGTRSTRVGGAIDGRSAPQGRSTSRVVTQIGGARLCSKGLQIESTSKVA